ncbi:unnamed protein product, partial [Darwinula stevensoni]
LFISLEHAKFHSLGSGEIQTSINRKSRAVSEIIDLFYFLGTVPAIIVNVTLVAYTAVTIKIAIWRNKMRLDLNDATVKSAIALYDSLSNYDTVAAFNNESLETERFDETLKGVESHSNRLWRSFYLLNFLQRVTFSMQTASIIFFGTYGIYMENMKPGTFILYLTISKILALNLDKLGYMYCRYWSAIINAKMTYFISMKVKGKEMLPIAEFSDRIEFKDVNFYHGAKKIMSNMNFMIKQSEKVALVGKNGSGKSTLLKILLKYNNYVGFVTIDGEDKKYQFSEQLRRLISYVQQDALLFNYTVRYNIKYGNTDCLDYFMISLCKKMDIHDSIMKLRDGNNTVVYCSLQHKVREHGLS